MELLDLPLEILFKIILYLNCYDMLQLSILSKYLKGICEDPFLWKQRAVLDFGKNINGITEYESIYNLKTTVYKIYGCMGAEDKTNIKEFLTGETGQDIKEGDMIDCSHYRGIGLYYFDGNKPIKTKGEYGYFLPVEAWRMVERYGIRFFNYNSVGAEYVLIPNNLKVLYENEEITDENRAIYIREQDDTERVIVDGKEYKSSLINFY